MLLCLIEINLAPESLSGGVVRSTPLKLIDVLTAAEVLACMILKLLAYVATDTRKARASTLFLAP